MWILGRLDVRSWASLSLRTSAAWATIHALWVAREVWCWGANDFGQLGTDAAVVGSSNEPLRVMP